MARGSAAPLAHPGDLLSDATESLLGRGTRVRGRIHGEGALRIEGAVEGDVQVGGDLEIDEGGSVAGEVEAGAIVIAGQLTGDVAARGAVTLRATARVQGDLAGTEVILEEGAVYAGRIEAEFDLPAELSARPAGRGHR